MLNPKSHNRGSTLASLATLYPEAMAMAVASNSRSGLALRLAENATFNAHRIYVNEEDSGKLANTTANQKTIEHKIMKHTKLILSLLTVVALAVACKPADEQSTQQQLDKVKQETKAAARDMKDYTYAQKNEFVETMQGQLTTLNHDLDLLAAKVEKSSDAVKADAKPKLQALRDQTAGLNKQLDEVRNATESTWVSVKDGFKKAYESSKDGFQQTRQWVSDKIAP